ncbi:MAG TPA: caspase family protein [Methanosarcina barkeri]|nr:caspase family protein [Methanosarcina barkeri]
MTDKRIGLVIGNNYPDSKQELRFAVADAIKMKEVLLNKDICGFDEVIDLVDRTSKEALVEVEKILKRTENDLIFIYFSEGAGQDRSRTKFPISFPSNPFQNFY